MISTRRIWQSIAAVALGGIAFAQDAPVEPGAPGGPGLAVKCAKAGVDAWTGVVFSDSVELEVIE